MDPRRQPRPDLQRSLFVLFAVVASAWLTTSAGAQEDLAEAYRQILRLWADGASNEAVIDLVALERNWVGRLDRLAGLQVAELAKLIQRNRRSLIAPARLHQLAFDMHTTSRSRRDFPTHALTVSDRAVRLSLRHGGKVPEIRKTAAVLLTSMAVLLRNRRYVEAAADRLDRATQLDPELTVAFEWGGTAKEELGDLGNAARLLRRLVELEPENVPGRLRLAMVEAKRGSRKATGLLEGIVWRDHRSWAWIFAVQELAQDYARSGREGEAIDLLRRASTEYPEDQGLAVALAFLDRDQRGRTRAMLGDLESRPERGSARVRYGEWPHQQVFDDLVQTTLLDSLPHLENALYQTEEERQ